MSRFGSFQRALNGDSVARSLFDKGYSDARVKLLVLVDPAHCIEITNGHLRTIWQQYKDGLRWGYVSSGNMKQFERIIGQLPPDNDDTPISLAAHQQLQAIQWHVEGDTPSHRAQRAARDLLQGELEQLQNKLRMELRTAKPNEVAIGRAVSVYPRVDCVFDCFQERNYAAVHRLLAASDEKRRAVMLGSVRLALINGAQTLDDCSHFLRIIKRYQPEQYGEMSGMLAKGLRKNVSFGLLPRGNPSTLVLLDCVLDHGFFCQQNRAVMDLLKCVDPARLTAEQAEQLQTVLLRVTHAEEVSVDTLLQIAYYLSAFTAHESMRRFLTEIRMTASLRGAELAFNLEVHRASIEQLVTYAQQGHRAAMKRLIGKAHGELPIYGMACQAVAELYRTGVPLLHIDAQPLQAARWSGMDVLAVLDDDRAASPVMSSMRSSPLSMLFCVNTGLEEEKAESVLYDHSRFHLMNIMPSTNFNYQLLSDKAYVARGFNRCYAFKMLMPMMGAYIDQLSSKRTDSLAQWHKCEHDLTHDLGLHDARARCTGSLLQRLQQGETVSLAAGWSYSQKLKAHRHALRLSFRMIQGKVYLIYANRGARNKAMHASGLTLYEVKRPRMLEHPDFLSRLTGGVDAYQYLEGVRARNNLVRDLGLELVPGACIQKSSQKGGRCSLIAGYHAVQSSLLFDWMDRHVRSGAERAVSADTFQMAYRETLSLYKAFRHFGRVQSVRALIALGKRDMPMHIPLKTQRGLVLAVAQHVGEKHRKAESPLSKAATAELLAPLKTWLTEQEGSSHPCTKMLDRQIKRLTSDEHALGSLRSVSL